MEVGGFTLPGLMGKVLKNKYIQPIKFGLKIGQQDKHYTELLKSTVGTAHAHI